MANIRFTNTSLGPFGCLLSLAAIALMGWLAYHFYLLLWWPAPVFFLLALLIDWRVPAAWGSGLLNMLKQNPLGGLVSVAVAAVFFPFTALGMFLNTLAKRRIERLRREFFGDRDPFAPPTSSEKNRPAESEYAEFEEIESKPKDRPQP